MSEILIEALVDTIKMAPFLYLSYVVFSYIEQKSGTYKLNYLFINKLGPLFGALLGIIPQCGFSIIAASLYAQGGITAGTLVACFIATSDEALPMFLSNPSAYKELLLLVIVKVILAIVAGYLLDLIYKKKVNDDDFEISLDACSCNTNIFVNALNKSLVTLFFVLLINIGLGLVLYFIGEAQLSAFLNVHPLIQPVSAALIGFIPNCAISILLVQLYMLGSLSFGSMVAGLSTAAGVGLAILFKQNKNKKEIMILMSYMWVISVLAGILIDSIL